MKRVNRKLKDKQNEIETSSEARKSGVYTAALVPNPAKNNLGSRLR
jgi:hypothetical protein